MDADLIDRAITELREAWPNQEIPDKHLRHWRDVLGMYSREVVRTVLMDAKTTMKGRPTWGEFGALCSQLSLASAKAKRQGPFLDDDGWEEGLVPANEPGWLEAAADAKRRLRGSTDAEKLEAVAVIAERRAAHEERSKPDWWGEDP